MILSSVNLTTLPSDIYISVQKFYLSDKPTVLIREICKVPDLMSLEKEGFIDDPAADNGPTRCQHRCPTRRRPRCRHRPPPCQHRCPLPCQGRCRPLSVLVAAASTSPNISIAAPSLVQRFAVSDAITSRPNGDLQSNLQSKPLKAPLEGCPKQRQNTPSQPPKNGLFNPLLQKI